VPNRFNFAGCRHTNEAQFKAGQGVVDDNLVANEAIAAEPL
jgi:hypothetical protein